MDTRILDRVIKPYFDDMFEGAELKTDDEGQTYMWTGFWVNGNHMIFGRVTDDEDNTWYSDGTYFTSAANLFGITWNEFYDAMKRYINKKYPELKIKEVR
jgi:hypothetical protein